MPLLLHKNIATFSFFLTFTANPDWPKISKHLLSRQNAIDRPNLTGRVFQLKKEQLLDLIIKQSIFSPHVAYCYTIEYQQCSFPHMHLFIWTTNPTN